ncbi:hypothetical protein [Tenacibaculum piscium]|uniref:hypothetical protein n=1 Tax=Tenacibaculum piscium TaxID=1458515 RepID=UPI001F490B53|nr:hypothetical protein [Tenacibaculum piscium]
MIKKSKITVKHYLEKKVKPLRVYRDLPLGYPLYYRITYKRKTTNLKSFTGAVMTEKAYEHFKKTNKALNYETNYQQTDVFHLKIEKELFFIEKALEEIINNDEDISAFDEYFIEKLKTFFKGLEESLYSQGWYKYKQKLDLMKVSKFREEPYTVKEILNQKIILSKEDVNFEKKYEKFEELTRHHEQEEFYYIFNKEKSLIYSLNILKKITGLDAFSYIHTNTIKFWHVIGLILSVYPHTLFIDFFINFDIDKIIKKNNNNKTVTNSEIKTICNKLKNNHLGVYFK